MRRGEAHPLYHYKLEVKKIYEKQTGPYAQIVKHSHFGRFSKVFIDCRVEVLFFADVTDAEIWGIVAECTSDDNDDESADVPCFEGEDRKDENEAADHAVNHGKDCHSRW